MLCGCQGDIVHAYPLYVSVVCFGQATGLTFPSSVRFVFNIFNIICFAHGQVCHCDIHLFLSVYIEFCDINLFRE